METLERGTNLAKMFELEKYEIDATLNTDYFRRVRISK